MLDFINKRITLVKITSTVTMRVQIMGFWEIWISYATATVVHEEGPRGWGGDYMCKSEWQRTCYCDINCFTIMQAVTPHSTKEGLLWPIKAGRVVSHTHGVSVVAGRDLHPSQLHQSPWVMLARMFWGTQEMQSTVGHPSAEHFSPGSKNDCKHNYVFDMSKVSI